MLFLKRVKKIAKKLSNPHFWAKYRYIKFFEKLPVQENTVLFESLDGKKIDGNVFYILSNLSKNSDSKKFKIYVTVQKKSHSYIRELLNSHGITNVHFVEYLSSNYFKILASAKYLVNDVTFTASFMKKPGQIYLNTWHGTPLKHLGKKIRNDIVSIGNVQKNFVCSDYILAPNDYTEEIIIKDYMLENIAPGKTVTAGYPRNSIFFDSQSRADVRSKLSFGSKKVYAYMPTWRDNKPNPIENLNQLLEVLFAIDQKLDQDEFFYVKIHPLAKNRINFSAFRHIRDFPKQFEIYEFLNACDVLVTDYSSVFFDFACTGKKIVLYPYDKEEYTQLRGMYLSLDQLPFPQVYDTDDLFDQLRSPKDYDDSQFLKTYCPYDGPDSANKLCNLLFKGQEQDLKIQKIPDNGKENVFIYTGNLAKNGITSALKSLVKNLDKSQKNYFLTFNQAHVKPNADQLKSFDQNVNFFAFPEMYNATFPETLIKILFLFNLLKACFFMKCFKKRFQQNKQRFYGNIRIDSLIQFSGYGLLPMLFFSTFPCRKSIFVHNDMINEIKSKHDQRTSVLKYAYNHYDNVAVVSEDIIKSTSRIKGNSNNIVVVHNMIEKDLIIQKSKLPILIDKTAYTSVDPEKITELLNSPAKKILNIGRFSKEKGQPRLIEAFYKIWKEDNSVLLFIMGGNSYKNYRKVVERKIHKFHLENNVILLEGISNPYPILRKCNYSILSSFYEGMPIAIKEADILEKPQVSTDIPGPHTFMLNNKGTLVDNSVEGIEKGLRNLLQDKVTLLDINYDSYNEHCVKEFMKLV